MFVAPVLAWIVGQVLLPESLALGLVVAATVPCTLASAAVWTRRGGGNDAIALLVTLVTNLACFLVLPVWLWVLLRSEVELDARALSLRLLLLVVAPVVAAQLLRLSSSVAQAASSRKPLLSYTAQLGVLTMVFFGAVNAGETLAQLDSTNVTALVWILLLVAVLALTSGPIRIGVDRRPVARLLSRRSPCYRGFGQSKNPDDWARRGLGFWWFSRTADGDVSRCPAGRRYIAGRLACRGQSEWRIKSVVHQSGCASGYRDQATTHGEFGRRRVKIALMSVAPSLSEPSSSRPREPKGSATGSSQGVRIRSVCVCPDGIAHLVGLRMPTIPVRPAMSRTSHALGIQIAP